MISKWNIVILSLILFAIETQQIDLIQPQIAIEPKRAIVTIAKSTGAVEIALGNGTSYKFTKAPKRPLARLTPKEDPDMFRALANDGKDVVIIRFISRNGKRFFDEDGLATIGEHVHSLIQDGDVMETEDSMKVSVRLGVVQVKGEEEDEVEASTDKWERNKKLRQEKAKTMRGKRTVRAEDFIHSIRHKRQSRALWLELGVFVDKGFYDAYVTKYGSTEAEDKVDSFVESAIDVIESDYRGLDTPIAVVVTRYVVWKTQPTFSKEAKIGGNIKQYLSDFAESSYGNAEWSGVDHSMLISGYQLKNNSIKGLAYISSVCKAYFATSVLNSFGLALGEIASHEIAHSFSVRHDGENHLYEKNCENKGYLMASSMNVNGESNLLFSKCSRLRFNHFINELDKTDDNCLTNSPCKDVNSYNYCDHYAKKDSKYCGYRIPSSHCTPVNVFPAAQQDGYCTMKQMCRQTCHSCKTCKDVNLHGYCDHYAKKDSKYCNWYIPNKYCKPESSFPSTFNGGKCLLKEMCRDTCYFC